MAAVFVPKDRSQTEHRGRLDRVIFADPDQPFAILALDDGATVCGPADADEFVKGIVYRFLGKWADDAKRGMRFKFDTHVIHSAFGRASVVKYLTEVCDDLVTTRQAGKLFDKCGPECLELLRTDPARVAGLTGLALSHCEDVGRELEKAKKFEATRIELFTLFAGRGFHGKLIDTAIDTWGVKATQVIRRNPFALLGKASAGFKRCDKMWLDLGLSKTRLKRAGLCAWNMLRNETNGHTWVEASTLAAQVRDAIVGVDVKRAFKFALRARRLKKHVDADGKVWLAVYDRAVSEETIAVGLRRLTDA